MTLAEKLNPNRFSNMSGKMAAIVGAIIGNKFTEPEMHGLAISSDGYVTSMETFIGTAIDLEDNIERLLEAAELSEEERNEFARLFYVNVNDWRR